MLRLALIAQFLLPLTLPVSVHTRAACDPDQLVQSLLPKLEELQTKADARDAKYGETTKAKMAKLATLRGWSKQEARRIYVKLLLKATASTTKTRAKVVSDVSDLLAAVKKKNPAACAKIKQLDKDIRKADLLNVAAWAIVDGYLDKAIKKNGM